MKKFNQKMYEYIIGVIKYNMSGICDIGRIQFKIVDYKIHYKNNDNLPVTVNVITSEEPYSIFLDLFAYDIMDMIDDNLIFLEGAVKVEIYNIITKVIFNRIYDFKQHDTYKNDTIEKIRDISKDDDSDAEIIDKALRYYYDNKIKDMEEDNDQPIESFVRNHMDAISSVTKRARGVVNESFQKKHLNVKIINVLCTLDHVCGIGDEFSLSLKNIRQINHGSFVEVKADVYIDMCWLVEMLVDKSQSTVPSMSILRPEVISKIIADGVINNLKSVTLYDMVLD